MPDKKDCCNKGAALEALQWVLANKKAWAVLLMIAKLAPQAIVRAVRRLQCGPQPTVPAWLCPQCCMYVSYAHDKCPECDAWRDTIKTYACRGCDTVYDASLNNCTKCGARTLRPL